MERRDFLKKGCILCIGGAMTASILQSCLSIPIYKTESINKKVIVPLEKFGKENFLIVRPSNVNYDVAVIKNLNSEYKSYIMVCTHAFNPLNFNGKEFSCSLHGSIFNNNGNVERGPAEKSLIILETFMNGDSLSIKLI